ncbi:sigma-70 family RNA polymerase sigma factor [Calycomorphotria hydatis]|uniref:RNA polymerase sigma factor n=1 Tax=Calycomorphotria hydatis TaxID=2528027 RepID=A0A517TDM9_9PLAN|nr:sigma-70 family RNA polymerase sigma factor [Calycomorphotria hydatis]QDT66467.1 RNA polymerase sigma factor [Calycomorphotria hydatis]
MDTRIDEHFESEEARELRRGEFLRLFQDARDSIHRVAYSVTGSYSDADDVVQESALVMWEKFHQFETGTNFHGWARVIVSRLAISNVKKRRIAGKLVLSDEALKRVSQVCRGADELLELRREKMSECFADLAEKDRSLIRECYGSNETIKSVAKRRNWNIQSIYTRLKRIKHSMQKCVDRRMGREVK